MNKFISKRFTLALTLASVMFAGWMLFPSEATSQWMPFEGIWGFTNGPTPDAFAPMSWPDMSPRQAPWIMAAPRTPFFGHDRDRGGDRGFDFVSFRDKGGDRDRHHAPQHDRHHECELCAFK